MDDDLDAWRNKRMSQLQSGSQGQNEAEREEQKKAAEDMKHAILSQILTQSARARLNTLMVGKPEKGKMVENMLVSMAQRGQIPGKLEEKELINLLERVNEEFGSKKKTTVIFDRRRANLDDSDDDL